MNIEFLSESSISYGTFVLLSNKSVEQFDCDQCFDNGRKGRKGISGACGKEGGRVGMVPSAPRISTLKAT